MSQKTKENPFASLQELPLLECVHCGICLSACPTYDLLGREGDSPRGRIYLIRALAEGRTELNEDLVSHLDACLGCRACESACPAGVPYGEMLARARDEVEQHFPRSAKDRRAKRILLDTLTNPGRMAPMMFGAKLMGALGPAKGLVDGVNRFLFGPKAPSLPLPNDVSLTIQPLPEVTPAKGKRRARVAVLAGCVMQVLFQRVNRATVRVLAENGCEVLVSRSAGCCGAFHAHNGFLDEARERARGLIDAYERQELDAIVINSAGCGSTMKEYGELFHDDPQWHERAMRVVEKSKDVSEFLIELGVVPPKKELRKRVTYHDACHLAHGQKIRSQPRELLETIPGIDLVEFKDPDWCCGSAGIYNFLQPELASRLQERKVENILAVRPEIVVTGNPGCHAWIEAGLRARGSQVPVKHTIEVLDEAYS